MAKDEKKAQGWENEPAKFMSNIFTESKNVGRRMTSLDFIDENIVVPQIRILYVVVGVVAFIFADTMVLLQAGAITGYIWVPLLILDVIALGIGLLMLLSINGKSYFGMLIDFLKFQVAERQRRKSKNGVKTFHIEDVDPDTGMIMFDDDRVGYMYRVEGFINKTMLPSTVVMTRQAQYEYLIDRERTTKQKMITHVERANPEEQLEYLEELKQNHEKEIETTGDDEMFHRWCSFMISNSHGVGIKDYVDKRITNKELVIRQYLMLLETDDISLEKAQDRLYNATISGMYSKITPMTKTEIESSVGELLLW